LPRAVVGSSQLEFNRTAVFFCRTLARPTAEQPSPRLVPGSGPSRHFAAVQQLSRFRSKADVNWSPSRIYEYIPSLAKLARRDAVSCGTAPMARRVAITVSPDGYQGLGQHALRLSEKAPFPDILQNLPKMCIRSEAHSSISVQERQANRTDSRAALKPSAAWSSSG
jgi:hypothetical protein